MIQHRIPSFTLALISLVASTALYGCGPGPETDSAMEEAASGEAVAASSETEMHPTGLPNPFTVICDWGDEPPGRGWGRVSGVGIDPAGEHIWVAERCGFDVCIGTDVPVDYESGDERNPGYRRGVYIGNALTGELTAFVPAHEVEDQPLGMAGEGVVKAADGALYVGEVVLQGMTRYPPRQGI